MKIDVIVEGGIIQEVRNIPKGVTVRVIDYDIEGTTDDLKESPYDPEQQCLINEWEAA
jgi:hypothetical protein